MFEEICRYVSVAYLIVQALIFIDMGYEWSAKWLEDEENNGKLTLLFVFSGLFWAISICVIVFCFIWFTGGESDCTTEIILISITISLGILYNILTIAGCFEHGCNRHIALLASSIINLYCTYLCWDGLTSSTSSCNSWNSSSDTALTISFGLLVSLLALIYVSLMSKSTNDNNNLKNATEPILAKEEESGGEKVAYKEESDENYGPNMLYFHCFMLLSSFYLSMLLTNWGSANVTNNVSKTYEKY